MRNIYNVDVFYILLKLIHLWNPFSIIHQILTVDFVKKCNSRSPTGNSTFFITSGGSGDKDDVGAHTLSHIPVYHKDKNNQVRVEIVREYLTNPPAKPSRDPRGPKRVKAQAPGPKIPEDPFAQTLPDFIGRQNNTLTRSWGKSAGNELERAVRTLNRTGSKHSEYNSIRIQFSNFNETDLEN